MRRFFSIILILVLMFFTNIAFAEESNVAKLTYGNDMWISLHLLLQAQAYSQNYYDAGDSENDAIWTKGFEIKRSRIILNGEAARNITFFIQTDDLAANEEDEYTTTTDSSHSHTVTVKDKKGVFTQDAFINYKLFDELQFMIGMMPVPFMHLNLESAVSLLGVDYNNAMVPLSNTTNNWRDTGVQMRGLLFGGVVDYRIGVFKAAAERDIDAPDGSINPYDYPRYCGRIQVNILDPETGLFYSENYLGKKKVLSFGGGIDYQNHAVRDGADKKLAEYFAWTGDLTVDYRLAPGAAVALQGAYIHVKNQPGVAATEMGYYGQAGFLIKDTIQPVVKYMSWTTYRGDDDGSNLVITYLTGGLNLFINGHNANIKLEYQYPMGEDNKAASGEKKGTVQCQVFI